MPKAIYTPEAEDDLGRIVDYIAQDKLIAALEWLDKMRATCDLLATQPEMGQRIRTRRFTNARRHVVGNYVIYYRPTANGVEILMVVHGARDLDKLI